MKIHDLELFLVAVGEREEQDNPFFRHSLLVRVTTASGLEGWGEAALGWRPGELAARREALLAVLAGRSVYDIQELHAPGGPLAAALAVGNRDGRLGPLGPRVATAVVQSAGRILSPAGARLGPAGQMPLAGRSAQISRELAEQGFHTQTVVTGGKPDEDLQNLRAIREMMGDRIELRLDGLGRFDADAARDLCAGLEFEGLQFFARSLEHAGTARHGRAGPADERVRWRRGGRSAGRPTC